ncbi:unnamed protein product [Amoebophrya sp. A120]|nr:unnamed protein product [Amoebophrya sp. A120]|eukprot:GSA120T00001032001.1
MAAPAAAPGFPVGMKVAKAFTGDLDDKIVGIDVSRDLVLCYSERQIAIYDVTESKLKRKIDLAAENPPKIKAGSKTSSDVAMTDGAPSNDEDSEDNIDESIQVSRKNTEQRIVQVTIKQTDPSYAFLLTKTVKKSEEVGRNPNQHGGGQVLATCSSSSSNTGQDRDVEMTDANKASTGHPTASSSTKGGSSSSTCPPRMQADRLQLRDLFQDQLMFQITMRPEMRESINFLALHPNQDTLLLGTTGDISLWDYSSYFKKKPGGVVVNTTAATADKDKDKELNCLGRLSNIGDVTCGAFDSQGMVFGLCNGKKSIHLFDSKTFLKGSFLTFDLAEPCLHLEFSPCGKYVLCNATHLLDAYDGDPIVTYKIPKAADQAGARTSTTTTPTIPHSAGFFSPDSAFVLHRHDGSVSLYSTTNGDIERIINGFDTGLPVHAMWNPGRPMIVTSSGNSMHWWV